MLFNSFCFICIIFLVLHFFISSLFLVLLFLSSFLELVPFPSILVPFLVLPSFLSFISINEIDPITPEFST